MHFNAWKKVLRFAINVLKIFILVIVYLVVRNIEVKDKADKLRQEWTCETLLFYNYILFFAICQSLALRVCKN